MEPWSQRGKHAEWQGWSGHPRWKPALELLAGLLHNEKAHRLDAKAALNHAFFAAISAEADDLAPARADQSWSWGVEEGAVRQQ